MEKFITSIKKKYREQLLVHERQWPLCHSSKIINLLLVRRKAGESYYGNQQRGKAVEETKQSLLDYSKLFEAEGENKPVRKVLVEGDAGIGKTSFCLSVIKDWANGKIFCEFKLVLFLPLRHRIVSSAGSLLELLKLLHPSKEVCKSVASFLEMEEGEKVLIIADGWDELDKSGRQEGSFLCTLLFEDLPFASIIFTSRPSASRSLQELTRIDQCVEIHGFSKISSQDYILSEFADDRNKARRLLDQISITPFLGSICSVPLNCAILCHLWRTREEALPTTMTDLHTKVILNIILRNLQKNEAYKSIKSLADFDALPDDLVESWRLLCEFAYHAMEDDQIVFSREKLATFFPQGLALDKKILCFGLLQSAELILETGCGVSFHFLHQVFQEYLAALHIVKQPYDKQLEIIKLKPDEARSIYSDVETLLMVMKQMSSRSFRFSLVWRFFCGIYFRETMVDPKVQQPNVEHLTDALITMIKESLQILFEGWLHLCLLAFEARNELVSQKVIQAIYGSFQEFRHFVNKQDQTIESAKAIPNKPSDSTPLYANDFTIILNNLFRINEPTPMALGRPYLSAYDCAAIIFVISSIHEHNNIPLILDFSWSGIGDDSIRVLTDTLVSKNGALKIYVLNLSGNKLADNVLGDLFSRASAAFDSLQVLEISDNKIGTGSLMSIAAPKEKHHFKTLCNLDLSNNRLSVSGIRALDKAAKCGTFDHLHWLYLEGSLSINDSSINDDLLNTFASCCLGLFEINISHNILGIPGAVALGRIVCKSNRLIPILYPSLLKHAIGRTFWSIVPQFTIILTETNLGDSGLIAFVENLSGQICFHTLNLNGNCIHNTGISCLIEAMHSKRIILANELFEFDFGNNPFGTCGTHTIGKMLSNGCYEFTDLKLSHCQLTNVEIISPSSESDRNMIGVQEVGQLLCQLPQTDILFYLTLDGNNFTGEGIYVLAGFMHLCPSLSWLSCINCGITSEDLLLLFDIIFGKNSPENQCPCKELIKWRLDHNRIDDRGFSALMEHLPTQFPKLGYANCFLDEVFVFDGNPVSPELARVMNDEMERRQQVRCGLCYIYCCSITYYYAMVTGGSCCK